MAILGVVFVLFLVYSLPLLPSEGQINLPHSGQSLVATPGEDIQLAWTFDDEPSTVLSRSWVFRSSSVSSSERLAHISYEGVITILNSSLPRVNVAPPATLVLQDVDLKYNGTYEFHLVTLKSWSSSVTVFIAMKPTAEIICSTPTTVDKGENITCVCKSSGGYPPANETWTKDGRELTPLRSSLSFNNVNSSVTGKYICVAQSYTLKDMKSVEIIVRGTPPKTTPTTDASKRTRTVSPSSDKEPPVGLIVGIVVGILAVGIAITVAVIWWCKSRENEQGSVENINAGDDSPRRPEESPYAVLQLRIFADPSDPTRNAGETSGVGSSPPIEPAPPVYARVNKDRAEKNKKDAPAVYAVVNKSKKPIKNNENADPGLNFASHDSVAIQSRNQPERDDNSNKYAVSTLDAIKGDLV